MLKNTLVVPHWFYSILQSEGFDILSEKYCRDSDLIYVDKDGRPCTFRALKVVEGESD